MKRIVIISLILIVVLSAQEVKQVLLLNSYHKGFPWTDTIVSTISEQLIKSYPGMDLYIEYMDTKRLFNEDYLEKQYKLYKEKYKGITFDVIIASDDNALNFLRKYHEELFHNVPSVFCGINNLKIPELVDHTLFTGILEEQHHDETVELALQLQPDLQTLFILSDFSPTGRARYASLQERIHRFTELEFIYAENTNFDNTLHDIGKIKKPAAILILAFFRDSKGEYYTYSETIKKIRSVSDLPIYCVGEHYLGMGVVGGVINSSKMQGDNAARFAIQILKGEAPQNIEIVTDINNPVILDYKELKSHKINKRNVPKHSQLINKQQGFITFYKENQAEVLKLLAIMLFVIVSVLLFSMIRIMKSNNMRKSVIEELKKALSKVKQLQGFLPICANCKKVRDDEGYWTQVEHYVAQHSSAEFSHCICPDCAKLLYPDLSFDEDSSKEQ